jgi:hypothetical protein
VSVRRRPVAKFVGVAQRPTTPQQRRPRRRRPKSNCVAACANRRRQTRLPTPLLVLRRLLRLLLRLCHRRWLLWVRLSNEALRASGDERSCRFTPTADGRTRSPASLLELCMLEIGRDLESYAHRHRVAAEPDDRADHCVCRLEAHAADADGDESARRRAARRAARALSGRRPRRLDALCCGAVGARDQERRSLPSSCTSPPPPTPLPSVLGLAASRAAATAATPPSRRRPVQPLPAVRRLHAAALAARTTARSPSTICGPATSSSSSRK